MEKLYEKLYEIFSTILPIIITAFSTLLINKYTYNKNRPLDKLEITYNRVYYPLYRLIKNENINDDLINKIKFYLNKYDKYIDRSTLKTFNYLCKCNTEAKKKVAYQNFKDNIYNKNSYLRRKLGYLEPNFLQMYIYFSKSEKSTFRICIEIFFIYLFLILGSVSTGNLYVIVARVSFILFVIIIFEIVYKFLGFLYYKIRK